MADRWADLAIATWSTTWNYGPGWEIPLPDACGVDPNPTRTRYYTSSRKYIIHKFDKCLSVSHIRYYVLYNL